MDSPNPGGSAIDRRKFRRMLERALKLNGNQAAIRSQPVKHYAQKSSAASPAKQNSQKPIWDSMGKRFTKLHEFVFFVVLPALVVYVMQLIGEPQMGWLFLIGAIPVLALLHIVGIIRKRMEWWRYGVIAIVAIAYFGLFNWAKGQQTQRMNRDVSNLLKVSAYLPVGGDISDSDFTVVNESSRDVSELFLGCSQNLIVWNDGKSMSAYSLALARGSMLLSSTKDGPTYVQIPWGFIHAGGDVIEDRCLYPMYHHKGHSDHDPKEPSSAIVCADITIDFHYLVSDWNRPRLLKFDGSKRHLRSDVLDSVTHKPLLDQSKSARFAYADGFWHQVELDTTGGYCDGYVKQ